MIAGGRRPARPSARRTSQPCAPRLGSAPRALPLDLTYVIVAPLPEVEGPDGPEEQQHGPRNEDHRADLEQPRGAGGLHSHRGVRLRAGREAVRSAPSAPAVPRSAPGTGGWGGGRAPRAPPGSPSAAFPPERSWRAARLANFAEQGRRPAGLHSPPAPVAPPLTPVPPAPSGQAVDPVALHTHTLGHPPSHSRWLKSLTGQWMRTRSKARAPAAGLSGTHRGAAKLDILRPHQGDGHFVRVPCHGCGQGSGALGGSTRALGSVLPRTRSARRAWASPAVPTPSSASPLSSLLSSAPAAV